MTADVGVLGTFLGLLCVGLLAWLLSFQVIPRLVRLLGVSWQTNPLTARRLRRFRATTSGYVAFVLITSGFMASLFLELFCNSRPLYIRYRDRVRFPAIASWGNFLLPFGWFNETAPAEGFGLKGRGELDARAYSRWTKDPGLLQTQATDIEDALALDERRFRQLLAAEAKRRGLTYDVGTPLPAWKLKEADAKRGQARDLRALQADLAAGKARVFMPLYPFSPREQLLSLPGSPPHKPFQPGFPVLGTDSAGTDVLSQLLYGFRISLAFGVFVSVVGYFIGVLVGGAMGYFGGWFDIIVQRGIEIWSAIPFLYTIMIIASVVHPSFWSLAAIMIVLQVWISITYYERGEFYREKARDYVQAARALGLSDIKIMVGHILPNALVPVVTFLPFDIVAFMSELVALDFLGFGLPPGTPSWGELLRQGSDNIVNYPHLVWVPVIAFAGTLLCVVLVGEAVREAFDPKPYARLR